MPKAKEEKKRLHPRNKNRERYDLNALISAIPELGDHVKPNKFGKESIDFASPVAVRLLNKALLKHYYGIDHWEFPEENLCPPVPGRADYIHHIADLLSESNYGKIPRGKTVTCFDIGMGANCIYPIIGVQEYDWNFIGSDIDPKSITSAKNIVKANPSLQNKVDCRLQLSTKDVFYGIITKADKVDAAICNPPFHSSAEEAQKGSRRKIKNLTGKKEKTPTLNFSGVHHELISPGGERKFIQNLIRESEKFAKNCLWFSTIVSKQSNLKGIYQSLEAHEAKQVRTIPMGTGNKSSRIVAWTFLSSQERLAWATTRWKTKPAP